MTVGAPTVESWEQQPGETAKQFEAFRTYLDLGAGQRSHRRVGQVLGKSAALIDRWATVNAWQIRTAAWDRDQARQWTEQTMVLRRQVAERDIRIADLMRSKVIQRLQQFDPSELSPRECAAWMQTAAQISRLALGEATERVEHAGPEGGPIQVADMTPEERRVRLEELLREAGRRAGLRLVPELAVTANTPPANRSR